MEVVSTASVRGTNPQNLVEKILRNRIFDSLYWKENCFGLTAATLVDKAVELKEVGGTSGSMRRPTPFITLTLRMLQIQPEKDIVLEYIRNEVRPFVALSRELSLSPLFSSHKIDSSSTPHTGIPLRAFAWRFLPPPDRTVA